MSILTFEPEDDSDDDDGSDDGSDMTYEREGNNFSLETTIKEHT